VAGVAQVYLERLVGMDFLEVQEALHVHFLGLIMAATLFSTGIGLFIWNFIRYGLPKDDQVGAPEMESIS
jgi:nitric oxide reductase subunit B